MACLWGGQLADRGKSDECNILFFRPKKSLIQPFIWANLIYYLLLPFTTLRKPCTNCLFAISAQAKTGLCASSQEITSKEQLGRVVYDASQKQSA